MNKETAARLLVEVSEKCSVPMWCGGLPAGTCGNNAYGKRPEGKTHRRWDGYEYRDDGRYPGYVPGLACPEHGGPKLKEVAHRGDPCIYCGLPHDDVEPGPCKAIEDSNQQHWADASSAQIQEVMK